MSHAIATTESPQPAVSSHNRTLAVAIGLIAAIWFTLLSGWLGITPGAVMTKRPNVLFSSDTSAWIERFAGDTKLPRAFPYAYVHPLEELLWRPPCRALVAITKVFLPADDAGLLAARLLVAIIVGAGVGFLALLALQNEVNKVSFILLFLMYLLFTTNTTACLPEHFGIANGLLSIAFVAPILLASVQSKTILLLAMVVFAGGTTITNTVFPVISLIHYSFPKRLRIALLGFAILAGAGFAIFLFSRSWSIHWFVHKYSNLRLIRHPLQASTYAILALVFPAVGPTPHVFRYPGWDMVSYEPWRFTYYTWIQGVAVVAWLVLLFTCGFVAVKDYRTRPYALLLVLWLLFNVVLHNIWGDEFLLYAPHWSWALMALIVLGVRHFSRAFVAILVVPVVLCQIHTLLAIKSALQTITQ